MFVTLPGWFLNNDGVASITFAQPGSVGNLLGVLGLLTLLALTLILAEGRWHWQSGRPRMPKRFRGARSWLPSGEFTVAHR